MDDNKEFLGSDSETENNDNSDVNTNETQTDSQETTSSFDEVMADVMPDEAQQAPVEFTQPTAVAEPKKKSVIQLPIIIALICVVVVALGFLVFKCFFNTSVVGTWSVSNDSTADEATTATQDEVGINYYTFEDDGTASITLGTMKMVGTYTVTQEDGTQTITINIPYVLQSAFDYEVTGNAFTGRTLLLTNTEYQAKFTLKSANIKAPELKPAEDFKSNEKITGKWKDQTDYNAGNAYNISYTFNENGTVSINEGDQLYVEGVYTYDDSTITVTYYAGAEATMTLQYSFDGDILVINGLGYSKDTGASADES